MFLVALAILFIFPATGGLIAHFTNKEWKGEIRYFLAFSGAFLFTITLLKFIPEVYSHYEYAGYWALAGFLFQIYLERFTKGIEHGHLHLPVKNIWPLFVGLGIHAFLESIPIGSESLRGDNPINGLLFGVALHEMPAAFVLALTLKSFFPNKNILYLVFIYALCCPLGASIGYMVEHAEHSHHLMEPVLAFVTGTFLHISTTILFENSENHKFSRNKTFVVAVGVALGILSGLF